MDRRSGDRPYATPGTIAGMNLGSGGVGPAPGAAGSATDIDSANLPGQDYIDPVIALGNAQKDGKGSETLISEVDGDLGTKYLSYNTYALLKESLRENSTFNGILPQNHRHRGHRESDKFNLYMQKALSVFGVLYSTLRTGFLSLETAEEDEVYPLESEIAVMYHIDKQIRFKEWLLLKDEDVRWFI